MEVRTPINEHAYGRSVPYSSTVVSKAKRRCRAHMVRSCSCMSLQSAPRSTTRPCECHVCSSLSCVNRDTRPLFAHRCNAVPMNSRSAPRTTRSSAHLFCLATKCRRLPRSRASVIRSKDHRWYTGTGTGTGRVPVPVLWRHPSRGHILRPHGPIRLHQEIVFKTCRGHTSGQTQGHSSSGARLRALPDIDLTLAVAL